jgi:hypothetical protein
MIPKIVSCKWDFTPRGIGRWMSVELQHEKRCVSLKSPHREDAAPGARIESTAVPREKSFDKRFNLNLLYFRRT